MMEYQPPPGVKREDRPTHIWEYTAPGQAVVIHTYASNNSAKKQAQRLKAAGRKVSAHRCLGCYDCGDPEKTDGKGAAAARLIIEYPPETNFFTADANHFGELMHKYELEVIHEEQQDQAERRKARVAAKFRANHGEAEAAEYLRIRAEGGIHPS